MKNLRSALTQLAQLVQDPPDDYEYYLTPPSETRLPMPKTLQEYEGQVTQLKQELNEAAKEALALTTKVDENIDSLMVFQDILDKLNQIKLPDKFQELYDQSVAGNIPPELEDEFTAYLDTDAELKELINTVEVLVKDCTSLRESMDKVLHALPEVKP